MTLYFARWPIDVEADVADRQLAYPHSADDWESFDGPDGKIVGTSRRQRRCPACGLWVDWPEAKNVV